MIGDPRPERRITDHHAGYTKAWEEGKCRVCGARGVSRHHLVPRGQRGDDVDDNIVPLCGDGTRGCHGSLTDHHPATYPSLLAGMSWVSVAAALRASLTQEEVNYVVNKKSQAWLDRTYPWI